eukprot:scaffold117854_cov18-Prasinocladus_malaysianus.AAC.3
MMRAVMRAVLDISNPASWTVDDLYDPDRARQSPDTLDCLPAGSYLRLHPSPRMKTSILVSPSPYVYAAAANWFTCTVSLGYKTTAFEMSQCAAAHVTLQPAHGSMFSVVGMEPLTDIYNSAQPPSSRAGYVFSTSQTDQLGRAGQSAI